MNRKQKIILWSAVMVAILMALYPPWIMICTTSREQFEKNLQLWKQKGFNVTHTFSDKDFPLTAEIDESIEYHFIFNPPRLEDAFADDTGSKWQYKLDFGLLFGQWLMMFFISSIPIYMLRTKNQNMK